MSAARVLVVAVLLIIVAVTLQALARDAEGAQVKDHRGYSLPMDLCPEAEWGDKRERPCVWDARHQGNGQGQSVILRRDGSRVFITHKRAHRIGGV